MPSSRGAYRGFPTPRPRAAPGVGAGGQRWQQHPPSPRCARGAVSACIGFPSKETRPSLPPQLQAAHALLSRAAQSLGATPETPHEYPLTTPMSPLGRGPLEERPASEAQGSEAVSGQTR